MIEEEKLDITVAPDLVRAINYTFDENILTIGDPYTGVSSGTPVYVLESKQRLLNSIASVSAFAVGTESSRWFEQENTQLRMENYALRERIRVIEERLANIEAIIPKERVIILREISKEEAKEEIRNLFSTGRTLYYSDIAKELSLDLEMVVEICNELMQEGKIQIADPP